MRAGLKIWCLVACFVLLALVVRGEESIWKSPAFQKRFLGTYGVQAEVEPQLNPEEQMIMDQVANMMSGPSGAKRARVLLLKSTSKKSSATLDFTLGNIYFQLEEYPEAVRWFQRALLKFPSFLRAHKNLGLVQLRMEDFAASRKSLSAAVELGARDGLAFGLLGFACSGLDDYASAETAYRQAVLLQPELADWKLGLARCLFRMNRFADAASICDELIADDPKQASYRQLKANALLGMKESMQAAAVFEWLDMSGEATAANLNTLGDIYVNEGLMDLGAGAYSRSMKKASEPPAEPYIRNVEVLASRGGYEPAKKLMDDVRSMFAGKLQDQEQARLLKVESRIALAGGMGEAEHAAMLEEIVRLNPLDGEALILLGQHYARISELDRGILYFERAAALEKHEAEACLRHGQALVKANRYSAAIPVLKRALEIKPSDSVTRYLEQVERLARAQGGS